MQKLYGMSLKFRVTAQDALFDEFGVHSCWYL